MAFTLASIHIYPLKSCAPLARTLARIGVRGLDHDRRWMVVDEFQKFLTARTVPQLTMIRAVPDGDAVVLSAPGRPPLRLDPPPAHGERLSTQVWDDPVEPLVADAAAHAWVSAFLGFPCKVVYMDDDCVRAVDPNYAAPGDRVGFADAFPALLISQAALDHLNTRLAAPVPMLRFRPNLVVAGTAPHAEDVWKRVRIGEVEFDVVKPCTRCVFTTVDFERGERDPSGEPLRTL
ncbi:MAG TPA: MOSC N-terminal beta barrel domain-containing protein, partial [Rudaea sp.]